MRRVAHGDLRVAHGGPLEALEALHGPGARCSGRAARRAAAPLDDARLRRRRVVPLAGHALGDGDLDDLAAVRVELDERIAGVDAAEVEHAPRRRASGRAHGGRALVGVQQRVGVRRPGPAAARPALPDRGARRPVSRARHDAVPGAARAAAPTGDSARNGICARQQRRERLDRHAAEERVGRPAADAQDLHGVPRASRRSPAASSRAASGARRAPR